VIHNGFLSLFTFLFLNDPESVKEVLARSNKSNCWKIHATAAYTALLKMQGAMWEPPSYKTVRKLPFIPTEAEIDALIASSDKKQLLSCNY